MSNDLNKCLFIGRLGADPEMRSTQTGKSVANFRIAVGSSWKDKGTGEKKEQTDWVSIVAFDRLAEICGEYLRKGSQVFIEGAQRTRKWQDKNGVDRYSTEIIASQMQMLGGKPEAQPRREQVPGEKRHPPIEDSELSDDIPFAWAIAFPAAALLASILFGASSYVA